MNRSFEKFKFLFCCLFLVFVLFPKMSAAEEQAQLYSVGLGFELSSGKYGSNVTTETIFIPLTITVAPTPEICFSLEIPYIYQSNGNVTTTVAQGGRGYRTLQKTTDANIAGGTGGFGRGLNTSGSGATAGSGADQSRSGMGDMQLKAAYILLSEKEMTPQLKTTAFIKFPTADKNQALGTGEFDEGVALELSKWIGATNVFAEGGYVFQGKAEGYYLRNYFAWNAGAAYQLTDKLAPLFYLKGTSPPADGVDSLLEARIKVKYQLTDHSGMEGYLAKGITQSSPNYGGGMAFIYDF